MGGGGARQGTVISGLIFPHTHSILNNLRMWIPTLVTTGLPILRNKMVSAPQMKCHSERAKIYWLQSPLLSQTKVQEDQSKKGGNEITRTFYSEDAKKNVLQISMELPHRLPAPSINTCSGTHLPRLYLDIEGERQDHTCLLPQSRHI